MKIGTSLGKCVKDILDGKVSIDNVMFITSNTLIESEEQLKEVLIYYRYDGRSAYNTNNFSEEEVIKLGLKIWDRGLLHQRRAGTMGRSHMFPDTWYDVTPSPHSDSEAVQSAWNHYVMVSKLAR